MTRPESVVFLLVAYGNLAEVERFVAETRRAEPSSAVSFAVCDNSPTSVPTSLEDRDDVVLVRRPDNPGYLPGGLAALKTWVSATGGLPDWAVLSNTDLTTESTGLLDVLAEHDPTRPLVLAPRITEGEARIEKNPHLRLARSPRRHRLNHVVTRTPGFAYGYLVLSRVRLQLRLRRATGPGGVAEGVAPTGSTMYSPYGAQIFFSRGFLERDALPSDVPITAEEYVIAERARREGAPVVFEPRISVHHDPHTTTGPKVSWPRAVRLSRAFAYIDHDVRSASP
jgi:GT2 family glycosyltransferase